MTQSVNKILASRPLPSFLRSREGWGRFLEMKRPRQPHLHQIEPTNACSYACIMCPRAKKMKRPVGFMDMDLFVKVMDEVAKYPPEILAKEVELFHFGESLQHPRIVEMIKYASRRGLRAVLSVNPSEFTPEKAEGIFRAAPFKVIVSLDGYDDESYRKIRGERADYGKAIANIEAAARIRRELAVPTQFVVRMIRMNVNEARSDAFKTHWEGRGLQVELREFFPWGEKDLTALGRFEKFPPFMPCPFCWQYVVVQWNGDVVACCRDFDGVNVMGNVRDASLREIWNGPAYEHFRERMISGDYDNPICPPCMEIYYTPTLAPGNTP